MWLCVGLGLFITTATVTKIVEYLDAAVEQGLLISQTGKAKGALSLGDILEAYLAEAQLSLALTLLTTHEVVTT